MEVDFLNAKQAAELSGLSVRALHHFDEIGLLRSQCNVKNGYREYSEADLDKLQQILFFKQCGFSLDRIKKLLSNPRFDRAKVFELQKKHLILEKERIEAMLISLERTLKTMEGEDSRVKEKSSKDSISLTTPMKKKRDNFGVMRQSKKVTILSL